jgi:hypothetical protein
MKVGLSQMMIFFETETVKLLNDQTFAITQEAALKPECVV